LYSEMARSTLRPMRPKPLIATLTVMLRLPLETRIARLRWLCAELDRKRDKRQEASRANCVLAAT
jgi:hypothetical protein